MAWTTSGPSCCKLFQTTLLRLDRRVTLPQLVRNAAQNSVASDVLLNRHQRLRVHSRALSAPMGTSPTDRGMYKIATIPNAICLARIGATPLIGYLVVTNAFTPAFWLFGIAGATDLLDGWIARNVPGQKSLLGSVLDPIADKLLVSTMFVTLTYANLLPLPLTCVVILRDVCLITGGFYKRYKTMEPPYSLNRFFNPQVSSMQVMPTMMSKINTVLQLSLVALALASPVFQFSQAANDAVFFLGCATAVTTVASGMQYATGSAIKKL